MIYPWLVLNQNIHKGDYCQSAHKHDSRHQTVKLAIQLHQRFLFFKIIFGNRLVQRICDRSPHAEFRQCKHI